MEQTTTDVGADKAPKEPWNWSATVDPSRRYAVEERIWRIIWTFMGGIALWGLWRAVDLLGKAVSQLERL